MATADSAPRGPYSSEQIILAFVAGLLDDNAYVCGTEGDVSFVTGVGHNKASA